ncbi:hypothetical protein [Streptomyces oceani]|uniref:Uncharacterized protein n=1 Tax=Streptomyces oceani TaxID=1075402 RepID=A0A1E7KJ18_9ACTN|nr:hypothetical protein [Streptomyces oceani]OEV03901.1 hypothetical protein AN216_09665 [Streptomyces oceani]
MNTVPAQTPPVAPPPQVDPPHASEATRLLCAGTYLDAEYRDRVIDELYLMEHRVVAPSLGYDAARVLAHALRARQVELAWSGGVLGLLTVGVVASGWWLLLLVIPGLLLTLGRWVRGASSDPPTRRRLPAFWLRWGGRVLLAYLFVMSLAIGLGLYEVAGESDGSRSLFISVAQGILQFDQVSKLEAWLALATLLAMAGCVAGQQLHFTRVLRGELSPRQFPDAAQDPAEEVGGRRFQSRKHRIRVEQHAPLIMYHEARPFCGAGAAQDTWVLAVELRPDPEKARQAIGNATILAAVRPLIEQLREVAESSEREGRVVRDRLRRLRIDECVFLPMEGLPHREDAPYDQQTFEWHRTRAVEEGGEKRRHFLRVRVGGWEEELAVTVFVRVHTQGRMLMLEVAPHVLYPVRADFKDADHEAYAFADRNVLGKTVHVLARMASAPGQALVALGRPAVRGWRRLTGEFAGGLPEGPALSVRELGAEPDGSLFQSMDVDRYLKSVQDRIAYGVKTSLAAAGYQTDEFVQKIVNISNGGVNIESVRGSTFAVGDQARATTTVQAHTTSGGQTPPRRGTARDGQ